MGTHAEIHVWNDVRYAHYFRGARNIIDQYRWEQRYGWPADDAVRSRLIERAAYNGCSLEPSQRCSGK